MNHPADKAPVFLIEEAGRRIETGERLRVHALPPLIPSDITCIEDLAARYLTMVRSVQPVGPYRLLGRALGGLVAYELASELLGRDEGVEFLGMIECPRPRNLPSPGPGIVSVTERYCPQPLPIPVCYFASTAPSDLEASRSWRALAGDSLRVITSAAPTGDVVADTIANASTSRVEQIAAREQPYRPLVTIQVGLARKPPVIFVPGAGAGVTSCMSLVGSLRERTTVHALQPRGFTGTAVPHRTVQAAAAVYLRAIREVQPRGPYRLIGHSFGGWVAFEMACRLAAEGEAVDPIVLIDSDAPTSPGRTPRRRSRVDVLLGLIRVMEERTGRSTTLTRDALAALDYDSQLSRLVEGMKAIGTLPANRNVNDIRGLVRVFEANLATTYAPDAHFPGSAVLFQPVEHSSVLEDEAHWDSRAIGEAWRRHVGRLECVDVPGKHITMLERPHVEAIARHVSSLWSEFQGDGADAVAGINTGPVRL